MRLHLSLAGYVANFRVDLRDGRLGAVGVGEAVLAAITGGAVRAYESVSGEEKTRCSIRG